MADGHRFKLAPPEACRSFGPADLPIPGPRNISLETAVQAAKLDGVAR
jgi:hypothetical protein